MISSGTTKTQGWKQRLGCVRACVWQKEQCSDYQFYKKRIILELVDNTVMLTLLYVLNVIWCA